MFDTQAKNLPFYIALWLLIALVSQPAAIAQEGELIWWTIFWDALKGNLIGDPAAKTIGVYLPPDYKASEKRYPVIYVLHGFGGDANSLSKKVRWAMDGMIQNGEIKEMIAVFVDGSNKFGGSQYLSSATIGDYETYIVRDLVNFIDNQYRTIPHRNSRGITGFSMGGYGSMHLALKYPEVFSVVVAQASTYNFNDEWVELFTEVAGRVFALVDILQLFSEERLWEEFAKFSLPIRNGISYLAAVAPNPDKPPFYLDLPYEVVSLLPLRFRRVEEVWDRIVENDIIHELDRFLTQPMRLKGIKLVHGNQDETAFVRQARTLDRAMTNHGIAHEYEEHGGGHTFIAEKSLQFLSNHLETATPARWDVNNDGVVTILDLVAVAARFGERITISPVENPDVNRDGIVNILDLVFVAAHFGENIRTLAPPQTNSISTSATIRFERPRLFGNRVFLDVVLDTTIPLAGYQVQIQTKGLLNIDSDATETDVFRLDAVAQSGTLVAAKLGVERPWLGRVHLATLELEVNLNAVVSLGEAYFVSADGRLIWGSAEPFAIDKLLPQQTQLHPNYPNPFNPETWIPFQLHKSARVHVSIYDTLGREVRQFDLGHQPAGYYQTRERAVHWDGRNQIGERVASGTYFYRLEADDFVSLRRMVVLK